MVVVVMTFGDGDDNYGENNGEGDKDGDDEGS